MQTLKRSPSHLPHPSHHQHRHASKTTRLTRHRTQADLRERSSILRTRIHAARHARREDHLLGPLAPDRFATNDEYGCVSTRELRGVKNLGSTGMCRSPWLEQDGGAWRESLVEVGDRVVVVGRGGAGAARERGKVGRVTEVRRNEGEVVVEDLNLAEVKVPSYIMVADPSSPPIRTISLPIPLSQIRLVYPMTRYDSSGNAQTVDTIVEKLIRLPNHGRKRFIANSHRATGSWVEVPIQKKYQPEKEKPKDHDIDTLRFEVETSTWTPTLLRAPMPGGVIDELRNKYSKFRTRHDPGYQRAIDNRAARKAAWEEAKKNGGVSGFLSPAKEARAREVEELRKRGKPELETEVLEMIGEVMARKGVVMTEGRRREVERNLRGEVWGGSALAKKDGVEGEQEEMSANQEASLGKAGEELQNAMEKMGIDEVITSEGKDPRSDRHP